MKRGNKRHGVIQDTTCRFCNMEANLNEVSCARNESFGKMRAMMSILFRAIRRESRAGNHRKVLKHLADCMTDSY